MNTLAKRINELAKGMPRGWQAALARHCNVKAPSVADWCSGKTKKLEGRNLLKAAEFFKVNPVWLATGKGSRDIGIQSVAPIALLSKTLEEQVISLLAGMPDYYADAWISKVKGDADMQRAKARANQEVRQQQEERDRKKCDPPPIERRRTSR